MRSFLLLALPLLSAAALAPQGNAPLSLRRSSTLALADSSSNLALRCIPSQLVGVIGHSAAVSLFCTATMIPKLPSHGLGGGNRMARFLII